MGFCEHESTHSCLRCTLRGAAFLQEACCILLAEAGATVETKNKAGESAAETLPEWLLQRLTQ